ncbi:uncharacterized protein [Panulirus ornatus]|uniref:uncharacterized protein n=1 Tax=Panulirus ornatus TaxID=150431 RepID=UPI003A8B2B29
MTPTHSFTAAVLPLLLIIIQGVSQAIKITKLEVPSPLAVGEGGWLVCDWEDEGDHVYALKWYLGIDEFYRWTPLETPPVKTFPMQHFIVDTSESQYGCVRIRNVTVDAGGNYRCEVSGEAPVFKTSFSSAFMTVVDLPDERPRISVEKEVPYKLQQLVAINCSSHSAKPAPQLAFYINNQRVDPSWVSGEEVIVNKTTGLETAVRSLKFRLRPTMVHLGKLQVKCVASYPDLYWQSSEWDFDVDVPFNQGHLPGSQGFVSYGGGPGTTVHTLSLSLILMIINLLLR